MTTAAIAATRPATRPQFATGLRISLFEPQGIPRIAKELEAAGLEALFVAPGAPRAAAPGEAPSEMPLPRNSDSESGSARADPFVVLGAVAGVTSKITLGCLGSSSSGRLPALLAREVTALDVVSCGRAVLALSSPLVRPRPMGGLHGGLPIEEPAATAEALEICRALARIDAPTFNGRFWSLDRAWNEPRVRDPAPLPVAPLLALDQLAVGPSTSAEANPAPFDILIDAVARFADLLVIDVGSAQATGSWRAVESGSGLPADAMPADLGELRRALAQACYAAGRVPSDLPLVALCEGAPSSLGEAVSDEAEVLERLRGWREAGFAVVLDLAESQLDGARLVELGRMIAQVSR